MHRSHRLLAAGLALTAGTTTRLHAAAFTPGDLVVYTTDNGATALSSAAAPVNLLEFSPTITGQTPLQTIPISTNGALGANNFTASGSASSEGGLNRSVDGTFLTFGGVNAAPATATANNSTSRLIATVDATGTPAFSAPFTVSGGTNLRSVTANNTGMLYLALSNGSSYAAGLGTAPVSLNTTNTRGIGIFGGQLYGSASSATIPQVFTVGTGLPTAGPAPTTAAFSLAGAANSQNSFRVLDLDNNGVADTLYLALGAGGGGVQRYNIANGTATLAYTLDTGTNIFGLTLRVDPLNPALLDLYATTQGAANGANSLIAFTDSAALGNTTNPASPITTLATAGANQSFRGVDFAPTAVPEPGTYALIGGGLGLLLLSQGARRRRSTAVRLA